MRKFGVFLALLCLAACHHSNENNDAVRQAILDYLSGIQGLNVQAMSVTLDSVRFDRGKSEATVSIFLKGNPQPFMKKTYQLEEKDQKWMVIPSKDPAAHGMAPMPGAENPHGGGAVPQAGGKMPSPEDLPPAGKK